MRIRKSAGIFGAYAISSTLLERLRSNMESSMIDTFARSSEAKGTIASLMIRNRRADYVLAVKGKQENLETNIREYFGSEEIRCEIEKTEGYKKTMEKAHGQIEIRGRKISLKRKRFNISFAPTQFIDGLMQI